MNTLSEQEFLLSVMKLLIKHPQGRTIGEIKNSTRNMRRPRRIYDQAVFAFLEKYVEKGIFKRVQRSGRIAYQYCYDETMANIAYAVTQAKLPQFKESTQKVVDDIIGEAKEFDVEGYEERRQQAKEGKAIIDTATFNALKNRAFEYGAKLNQERELRANAFTSAIARAKAQETVKSDPDLDYLAEDESPTEEK